MEYFKNIKKLEKGKSILFKKEENPIVDLFADEKDVKIRIFDEKQEIFSDFDGTAIKEILNEIDFFYRGIAVKCLKEIKEIFIDFFNDKLEHLNNVRELAEQLSGIKYYEKINVYSRREKIPSSFFTIFIFSPKFLKLFMLYLFTFLRFSGLSAGTNKKI